MGDIRHFRLIAPAVLLTLVGTGQVFALTKEEAIELPRHDRQADRPGVRAWRRGTRTMSYPGIAEGS